MKQVRLFTISLLFVVAFLSIHSCTSNLQEEETRNPPEKMLDEETLAVAPPLENIDVPFQQIPVDAVAGEVIKLKTGTVIRVPENAFLDKEGNPIQGKVTLKYREFHDMGAVMASGITMTNKDDPSKVMQSAGMFEIQGEQNGQKLALAPEKSVQVDMASYVQGNGFDFFYLDESKCEWVNKGSGEAQANSNKEIEISKIDKALNKAPRKPQKVNKDKFVFNLDVNYENFPELKAYKNIIWQYDGKTTATDPVKNKWVFNTEWTSAELETLNTQNAQYKLLLTGGGNSFETVVTPVLSDDNYQAELAKFTSLNESYQKIKTSMVAERDRLGQEADLLRSFEVDRFGIFNWDIWKRSGRVLVKADFEFDESVQADINQVSIFLVNTNNRTLIRFTPKNFDKFSFDPTQKHRIVAILPGNKVASFDPEDFEELNKLVQSSKWKEGDSYTFKLKTLPDTRITSVEDVRKMLTDMG